MSEQNFKKLEVGEKYLAVKVLGGKDIPCYPQKAKNGDTYYRGDGIIVFVNKKLSEEEKKERQQKKNDDSL